MSISAETSDFTDAAPGTLRAGGRSLPVAAMAAAAGATSIVVGLLWDISWHRSIGRDTFWTPAHMAIYFGGLLAAAGVAPLIARATVADGPERRASVGIGPLRGPLGAWVMLWGAAAMVASAPFDDWWHDAYGLDVRVISPPHAVLAAGMIGVVAGAMLLTLSVQNGAGELDVRASGALYAWASGVLVTLAATFIVEYTFPLHQHGWLFYATTGAVFPLFLVACARASKLRFAAARAAAIYMAIMAAMDWVLPLFPAQPRLGPIYNPITRMVPFCFPLLLVFPALAMDLVLSRLKARSETLLAVLLGIVFVAVFLLVQWPFASFQMTPSSRNWFFLGDRYWSYWFHPDYPWRYGFQVRPGDRLTLRGMAIAAGLAIVSARAGLGAGSWMRRVRR
ncbi:MAG TPA: hypothetical protein VE007_02530 [Thermoanaerobaculia bacterium]|nr:hypothetical protein [Thermoanaerobaculia bacterium]